MSVFLRSSLLPVIAPVPVHHVFFVFFCFSQQSDVASDIHLMKTHFLFQAEIQKHLGKVSHRSVNYARLDFIESDVKKKIKAGDD